MKSVIVLVAGVLLLSGCGYAVKPYVASPDNAAALKTLDFPPLALGAFESVPPGLKSINCHISNTVSADPGFAAYVRAAFIDELSRSGRFDAASPRVLTGRLEVADFNSSVLLGKWVLSLTLANTRGDTLAVSITHPFTGNISADKGCERSAAEFVPAVRALIAETFRHPKFAALVK